MIKALLVDGDGIVLKKRDKYFSERLRGDGYNVSENKIKPFFKDIYPDIKIGKKDLKEEVSKYLDDWNWDKSVNELLEYWFSYENQLDQEVINILKQLRGKGIKIYLVSDHSKYRANDLWKNLGLKKYFDGHFFSCNLGVTKEQPDFYKKVLQDLQLQPYDVVFLDDEEENVAVAKKAGLQIQLYQSISQLNRLLQEQKK